MSATQSMNWEQIGCRWWVDWTADLTLANRTGAGLDKDLPIGVKREAEGKTRSAKSNTGISGDKQFMSCTNACVRKQQHVHAPAGLWGSVCIFSHKWVSVWGCLSSIPPNHRASAPFPWANSYKVPINAAESLMKGHFYRSQGLRIFCCGTPGAFVTRRPPTVAATAVGAGKGRGLTLCCGPWRKTVLWTAIRKECQPERQSSMRRGARAEGFGKRLRFSVLGLKSSWLLLAWESNSLYAGLFLWNTT